MRTGEHNTEQVEAERAARACALRDTAGGRLRNPGSSSGPRRKPSEDGYTLLAVMFLLTILTVWMAVAVPKMTRSIQRDREVETMHRGKQYIRAVQLYYRKFHAYPPNMDALVKTNEIRFLRRKYLDPLTGKDDWKPIMFGQNKAPIAMGFFGQPMATGSTLAGIGMSGGNGISGLNGASGSGFGSQNAAGTLGSIFNSQQATGTATSQPPGTGPGTAANGTDSSGNATGTDASGATGTGATNANGNPIQGTGTSGLSSSGPTAGQTFGGAGIIGVMPVSPKLSILIYKKKTHYNEWEFDYDPAMETMMQGGNTGMIGTPASNMSNPIGNSSFGSNNSTFGSGQTGGTPVGAGPGSQQTPANPQQ